MNIEVNFLAITLATFSSMVIGYIWYGSDKFGFGKKWATLTKIDQKKSNVLALFAAAISAFVMAWGLAVAGVVWQSFSGAPFMQSMLVTGGFVWLCFQALRMFQRARFNQERLALTAIHMTNEFATVLIASLIIGLFGV